MKLLKEFSRGDTQQDLKSSDQTDAGRNDTTSKPVDVRFSLMRNMINTDGGVSGSDVNDYLERAQDLNDEVDTVGFAIETDDGDFIKIYVNAAQADEFEQELAKLLGLDDDSEAALNTLAQKYDVVDVVWPTDPEGNPEDGHALNPEDDVSIDDDLSSFMDDGTEGDAAPSDDADGEADDTEGDDMPGALPADDEADDEGGADGDAPVDGEDADKADKPKKKSLMKDIAGDDEDDKPKTSDEEPADDTEGGEGGKGPEEIDVDAGADDTEADEEEDDGEEELDADGNPVKKKKPKKKDDEKEVTEEGLKLNRLSALAAHTTDTQEDTMSIGSKFLERITEAAPSDAGDIKDAEWKLIRNSLKRPYEKKIVELFSMLGIPGRYVRNEDGLEESIRAAGDVIRRPGRKQTAFNAFYDSLKPAATVAEAKKRGGRLQKVLESVMVALGFPEALVTVEGGGSLGSTLARAANKIESNSTSEAALIALAKALGITSAQVNEEDEDPMQRARNAAEAGRGPSAKDFAGQTKKPGWYVVKGARAVVQAGPFGSEERAESEAKKLGDGCSALFMTAHDLKHKVRAQESLGSKFLDRVSEEVDVGEDEFHKAVVAMALALGIPERNLQYNRPGLIKSLREKKMSLTNRGMIEQRMAALAQLIAKGTRQTAQPAVAESLTEGFKELEAMDNSDLKKFSVEEPHAGPALFASYDGAGNHKETHIILAVDPDIDGGESLYVAVTSPWSEKDEIKKTKHFTNDKSGYNQAKAYAENLRSLNPKIGGRPKGWKE